MSVGLKSVPSFYSCTARSQVLQHPLEANHFQGRYQNKVKLSTSKCILIPEHGQPVSLHRSKTALSA